MRTVQVHRLLIEDSVDERMLEILDSKSRLFDEYARQSTMTSSTPEAVDISDVDLARRIVARERARLFGEKTAPESPLASLDPASIQECPS